MIYLPKPDRGGLLYKIFLPVMWLTTIIYMAVLFFLIILIMLNTFAYVTIVKGLLIFTKVYPCALSLRDIREELERTYEEELLIDLEPVNDPSIGRRG